VTHKDFLKMSDEQIRNLLFEKLAQGGEIRRKQLIEACIGSIDFTAQQLADTAPGSEVNVAKSRIGRILSAALKSAYILEDPIGILSLNSSEINYISKDQARDFIVEMMTCENMYTKQELFELAEQRFSSELPPEEKNQQLRSVMGSVLARLESEKHVVRVGDRYLPAHGCEYPATELGCYLREAAMGGDTEKCFLKAVHTMGGEWFEGYAVELLERYFTSCGKEIISASVSGGSNDGGIDGIISTRDALGYRELILMQMKNRNATVTPKDVREFYGAVCAEQGTRGLYVCISRFHEDAQKLMDKVDNLIGIDGHRIFEMARDCAWGIVMKNGKPAIDEKFFLEANV